MLGARLAETARSAPGALREEITLLLVLRIDASAFVRPDTARSRPLEARASIPESPETYWHSAFVLKDERLIVALGEAIGGTTGFVGVVDGLPSPVGHFPSPVIPGALTSWH